MPALKTLRYIIFNLSKLMAPFTPFIAEHVYQEMGGGKEESIHLKNWPKLHDDWLDEAIINKMKLAQEIARLGLEQRAKNKIAVRQPLAKITIKFPALKELDEDLEKIILDELNIRQIIYQPAAEKSVELDFNITPELKEEGIARDLIRQINEMRKSAKLTINDKIEIFYQTRDNELAKIIEKNIEMIKKQTASKKIEQKEKLIDKQKEVDIGNQKILLSFKK